MQIELQNTSQTVQKFLENVFFSLSQRHLLLFSVCQGIQKYTRMDLLMTERLRSWLHISVPKIVLSIPNTLIKAAALWSHVCVWVFSIPRIPGASEVRSPLDKTSLFLFWHEFMRVRTVSCSHFSFSFFSFLCIYIYTQRVCECV